MRERCSGRGLVRVYVVGWKNLESSRRGREVVGLERGYLVGEYRRVFGGIRRLSLLIRGMGLGFGLWIWVVVVGLECG